MFNSYMFKDSQVDIYAELDGRHDLLQGFCSRDTIFQRRKIKDMLVDCDDDFTSI